ncbi:BadF/BadG/BcrA/BcrD ATPase family protein [Fictibacillus sp. B-59209]|uniref:BadF/BadG/BcrA/BcrD ATPase family protein n=1 Tax=Fictibacillus sp. B-59209 TaxID=3024873 RepID=UPI002E251B3A|nr:BadF/BadG/BcrA/BcrD ATPase family protein [Fictibacillus sp. B-59209]
MEFIIGVDGGGTKTEAVAYDLNGKKCSEGKSGYGNLLINQQKALIHILEAVEQCLIPLDRSHCRYICLGLAGYGGVENTDQVKRVLSNSFATIPFKIVNDGIIAHAALLKGNDGILTIAGTGSVSIGIHQGLEVMAGGWGHLLGDEGSGYWIAMQAFKKMTQEEDEGSRYSKVTTSILDYLAIHQIADLKKFIYSCTKSEIASLVPLLVRQAERGDEFSQQIFQQAGYHLAKTTLNVCKKLNYRDDVTIAIKGSVLANIPLVQTSFIDQIKNKKSEAKFILVDVSSTVGCYHLALKEIG